MGRDLNRIRRGIAARKRRKGDRIYRDKAVDTYRDVYTVDDEEMHGFERNEKYMGRYPSFGSSFVTRLVFRIMMAACLFFGVAILLQQNMEFLDKPKSLIVSSLSEEFPFATVNSWYQERFGEPAAVIQPDTESADEAGLAMPVNGTVVEPFEESKKGILIESDQATEVVAVEEGIVIFAGNNSETGKTIIVQHADKSNSIYGHLDAIEVNQYQLVEAQEKLGEFVPSEENAQSVYFALQQGNTFLNPMEGVQVDSQ